MTAENFPHGFLDDTKMNKLRAWNGVVKLKYDFALMKQKRLAKTLTRSTNYLEVFVCSAI